MEESCFCNIGNMIFMIYELQFLGPISSISVLSEFNKRKLLVIQSFIFLTHSVSLDSLEVSSGLVEI